MKTVKKKISKIMIMCFWEISLIEDHIHFKRFACYLHSNVFILIRFISSGAIMRTHRLMLTLDLGISVLIRSLKKNLKMKIQSLIGLIGSSIGCHLLLIFKIEYFVCMVALEPHLKLSLIFRILKDHLK